MSIPWGCEWMNPENPNTWYVWWRCQIYIQVPKLCLECTIKGLILWVRHVCGCAVVCVPAFLRAARFSVAYCSLLIIYFFPSFPPPSLPSFLFLTPYLLPYFLIPCFLPSLLFPPRCSFISLLLSSFFPFSLPPLPSLLHPSVFLHFFLPSFFPFLLRNCLPMLFRAGEAATQDSEINEIFESFTALFRKTEIPPARYGKSDQQIHSFERYDTMLGRPTTTLTFSGLTANFT